MADRALCSIAGCDKRAKALTLCMAHYMRQRKYGTPIPDAPLKRQECNQTELRRVLAEAAPDQCWNWPFQCDRHGYAMINYGGSKRLTHRLVCEIAHGVPPSPTHEAAHACGKGHLGCVNPHHLSWKTPEANRQDKKLHGTARNWSARLYESDVIEIRKLAALGGCSRKQLAERFGVTPRTIGRVIRGELWAATEAPPSHN